MCQHISFTKLVGRYGVQIVQSYTNAA